MNYVVIHKQSQLVLKVITSPSPPKPDNDYSFYEASIIVLNHYYRLYNKALSKGVQVSVGELMASSPSFREQVSNGKQSKVQIVTARYR